MVVATLIVTALVVAVSGDGEGGRVAAVIDEGEGYVLEVSCFEVNRRALIESVGTDDGINIFHVCTLCVAAEVHAFPVGIRVFDFEFAVECVEFQGVGVVVTFGEFISIADGPFVDFTDDVEVVRNGHVAALVVTALVVATLVVATLIIVVGALALFDFEGSGRSSVKSEGEDDFREVVGFEVDRRALIEGVVTDDGVNIFHVFAMGVAAEVEAAPVRFVVFDFEFAVEAFNIEGVGVFAFFGELILLVDVPFGDFADEIDATADSDLAVITTRVVVTARVVVGVVVAFAQFDVEPRVLFHALDIESQSDVFESRGEFAVTFVVVDCLAAFNNLLAVGAVVDVSAPSFFSELEVAFEFGECDRVDIFVAFVSAFKGHFVGVGAVGVIPTELSAANIDIRCIGGRGECHCGESHNAC